MGEAPTASMGGGGVGLIAATGVDAAGPVKTQKLFISEFALHMVTCTLKTYLRVGEEPLEVRLLRQTELPSFDTMNHAYSSVSEVSSACLANDTWSSNILRSRDPD